MTHCALGQGGRPPGVRVGLEMFQNAIDIIPNKFCKKNFALKRIPGLDPIWVTPEVLHEDYPQAHGPGVGGGAGQAPVSRNRGPA